MLEFFVTKSWDRKAALKFLCKAMKRYGRPGVVVTDKLRSDKSALRILGNASRQETGSWLNNRLERHFCRRDDFMENRTQALAEWRQFAA